MAIEKIEQCRIERDLLLDVGEMGSRWKYGQAAASDTFMDQARGCNRRARIIFADDDVGGTADRA